MRFSGEMRMFEKPKRSRKSILNSGNSPSTGFSGVEKAKKIVKESLYAHLEMEGEKDI